MRVYDFDGVIFNSQGNYTDDFLVINQHNKALVATLPFIHMNDILITGRSQTQESLVLEILAYNNIHFCHIIFSAFTDKDYKAKNFFDKYHAWKKKEIYHWAADDAEIIDDDEQLLFKVDNGVFKCRHIDKFYPDLRTQIHD